MSNSRLKQICIGTSGYIHKNWHDYLGDDDRKKNELTRYAQHFNFVEINYTFYKEPTLEVMRKWKKSVPKHFKFSIKVHRYFTHTKRLNVDEKFANRWESFWSKCLVLKPKLGPLLFQLPPMQFSSVGKNSMLSRLVRLKKILPLNQKIVFECRDTSWNCTEVRDLFKKFNWSMCFIHVNNDAGWVDGLENGFSPPVEDRWLTANWGVYYRFHGTEGAYYGAYKKSMLRQEAKKFIEFAKKGKAIFVAFNNTDDTPPSALKNAHFLNEAIAASES